MTFRSYTVLDGLSHNFTRQIYEDSKGFIWISTEDGLNRFDNYSFKVYRNNTEDSSSISNNIIMDIEGDLKGNIWVGTWGGGISIYNKVLDSFTRLRCVEGDTNTLTSDFIYDIFRDSQERIWVGTIGGISMIDINTGKITNFSHEPNNPQSISSNRVRSITEDENNKLWLGTLGGGLNYFDPATGICERFVNDTKNPNSISSNEVYVVFYDSQKRLWAGTWGQGLNLMVDRKGSFKHFTHNPEVAKTIANNEIWCINETPDKRIWIGTDNGLCLFNETDNNFHIYQHFTGDPKSLSANSIKGISVDRHGRLWIGTYNGGFNIFDEKFVRISHYYQIYGKNSLSDNDISSFLELDATRILIGTGGGGLDIFNKKTGLFTNFKHDTKNPKSIGSNKVKSLFRDEKGQIWIGFWGGGLDLFNIDKKTFEHYKTNEKLKQDLSGRVLSNENINFIDGDGNGNLWLATFGGGVNKFNPDKGTFEYFSQGSDDPLSLSDRLIWSLLYDTNNGLWVGTSNGMLDYIGEELDSTIHISTDAIGGTSYVVQDIFEDSKQQIWLGLEGGGLGKVDKQTKQISSVAAVKELIDKNVNAIEEDKFGNLWLATNRGLSSLEPEKFTIKNYDLSDGLQGMQFNRQASLSLSSGELIFGGTNGFNLFNPNSNLNQEQEVSLVLTDFQLFNTPVSIGMPNSPLNVQIDESDSVILSHEQSLFSVEYAGLNYASPEKIRYQYKLEGFINESWQYVGKERKVTFSSLPPKTYVLSLKAILDGNQSNVRKLTIIVLPPWWQTWWARVLALILVVAIIIIGYKLRVRSINAQNKLLENKVAERTESLSSANKELMEKNRLIQEQKEEILTQAEELEESNEEIRTMNHKLEERVSQRTADLIKSNKELDNFVYRVSHDIRAPLSSILGLVSLMREEHNPDSLNHYLNLITKSINRLDEFVKDILDYSRNSRLGITKTEFNIDDLLQNVLEELQFMENANKLQIIREVNIDRPFVNDQRRLHVIFRNLVSNAIKYQDSRDEHNSFLKIIVISTKGGTLITVEDNGIGIPEERIEKVFDMFYRVSEISKGSGIGLYIVKETVEKLNGTVTLKSEQGKGSKFEIWLPDLKNS